MKNASICGWLASAAVSMTAVAAHSDPLPAPSFGTPLAANPKPVSFDAGPIGKLSVGGALTGAVLGQDHVAPGDKAGQVDFTNAQVWVEKTDGPVQFFAEVGGYSFPALGVPYLVASKATDANFGLLPVGYVKFAPSSQFSIIAGKLPTLIGAESGFTFQNMNINRGLLWNQEPLVSRGVQANYSQGPVSLAVSVNDGFYSDRYNWVSGSLAYTVTPADTVTFVGGGNVGKSATTGFTTPLLQNNSAIYNLIYTHSTGPLTITPYLQYTTVLADRRLGIAHSASTWGAALLAKTSLDTQWSLAGRAEYIQSSGSAAHGDPNLLYGAGSKAWSLTVTPTFQQGVYFVRGELAYTQVLDAALGSAFGSTGLDKSQIRGAIETGVLF
jgi:hypothetical protein